MISRVAVPDGELVVEESDQGGKGGQGGEGDPVVLVHGFALDRRMWKPQVSELSADFRVVTYDLRGFGDSSLPAAEYSHTADLLAVLDHLNIKRAHVVGLSLGANVALSFAANHPERVASLVLASSGLIGHDWKGEERPPAAAESVAREQGHDAARAFWLAHPLFASLDKVPEAKAAVQSLVQDYSGWHWKSAGRGPGLDPVGALSDVRSPTLVMSGDLDAGGYRDIAGVLAAQIPGAEIVRFPEAGHMCNLEVSEAFNEALRGFLDRVPKPTDVA